MTDQLPAYIKQRDPSSVSLARRGLQNVGAGSPPYLSIEGGRFTLIDAGQNAIPIQNPYIDVVVVDLNDHVSKVWFGEAYDPSNPAPPRCFSDNGKAPSQLASEPQSPTCASCAFNKWGSKISQFGSEVKECADHQKIALVVPGFPGYCFLLRIPGGSFKNWRAYLAKFERAPFDVFDVLTRITFDVSERKTGVLAFQGAGYLDPALAQEVGQVVGSGKTDMLVGRTDTPILLALQGPPAQGQVTYQPQAPTQQPFQQAGIQGMPAQQPQFASQQPFQQTPQTNGQQPPQAPQRARRGRKPAAQQPGPGAQAPFQQPQAPAQQPFKQTQPAQQPAYQPQQPFQPAQQPFQQPQAPAQQPFQQAQQPGPQPGYQQQQPGQTFGFAQGNPPPNDMMDAIKQTFG